MNSIIANAENIAEKKAALPQHSLPLSRTAVLLPCVLLASIFGICWLDGKSPVPLSQLFETIRTSLEGRVLHETVLNPWFYGVYGISLVLSVIFPARKEETAVNSETGVDVVWFVFKTFFVTAIFLPLLAAFLTSIFAKYFHFLSLQVSAELPFGLRFLVALLFGDFVFWFVHMLRHKVEFFWRFHAIHHSQEKMSFLTEYRTHPVDDFFIYLCSFIPVLAVDCSAATLAGVVWVRYWHTRLYHANIRSDFGPLKYIFVTPQSHRIHHSIEERHQDKNFGLTFSIWDYLFGTQWKDTREYPATGIRDDSFPKPSNSPGANCILVAARQLMHPFFAKA